MRAPSSVQALIASYPRLTDFVAVLEVVVQDMGASRVAS
jgi:hypothetical protein